MDLEIIEIIEKKLFSFTNSAVAEALKVTNIVAIEVAFPCISEGRRGGRGEREGKGRRRGRGGRGEERGGQ